MWGPTDYGSSHGEATAFAVARDGNSFAISGHKAGSVTNSLHGKLTSVRASDGTQLWTKQFQSTPIANEGRFIKNECWGVEALSDGYVLGCGTGIENCENMGGFASIKSACDAGTPIAADPRAGSHPRKASVWQSLIIRTDLSGTLQWQRVDQYRASGTPALGSGGWEEVSSASEWVVASADGGLWCVQDQELGAGLMKLGAVPPSPPSSPPGVPALASPPGSGDEGLGTGAIVGIAIAGVVAGLCLCAVVAHNLVQWRLQRINASLGRSKGDVTFTNAGVALSSTSGAATPSAAP